MLERVAILQIRLERGAPKTEKAQSLERFQNQAGARPAKFKKGWSVERHLPLPPPQMN